MQTLKFKIEHKYNDLIIEYQKQYSILLHSAFKYFQKEDNDLKSLFDYKYISSPLMKHIQSLNNITLMNNWFIQCAISEAYQLFKSYQSKLDEYNQKLDRKQELLNKEKRTLKENKELRKLFKAKFPKIIFGGKENFYDRCSLNISKDEFK